MREIKFRCWDKNTNKMSVSETLESIILGAETFNQYGDLELMQFTGLLDKSGKEIYEGDIVRISDDHIEEVKWVDETNWVGEKCPVNGFVNHSSIYKKPIEVIGNIYENKELLEDNGGDVVEEIFPGTKKSLEKLTIIKSDNNKLEEHE